MSDPINDTPTDQEKRITELIKKQSAGTITEVERAVLEDMRADFKLMSEYMYHTFSRAIEKYDATAMFEKIRTVLLKAEPVLRRLVDIFERYPELSNLNKLEDALGMSESELSELELWEVFELLDKRKGYIPLEVSTIAPVEHVLITTKLSTKLFDNEIDLNGLTEIGGMNTLIQLEYADLSDKVALEQALEPYDRTVHDAVCTLLLAGNKTITTAMIYRTMIGKPGSKLAPSAEQARLIDQSLNKGLGNRITIDSRNEDYKDADKKPYPVFKSSIYQYDAIEAMVNGVKTSSYQFNSYPVLLRYADQRSHISRIDPKLLDTPLNKDKRTQTLQDYIIRRIVAMKNGKSKLSRKILLETIFEKSRYFEGVEEVNRKEKGRALDKIKTILDHLKNEDFIKGYELDKTQRTITGIIIKP